MEGGNAVLVNRVHINVIISPLFLSLSPYLSLGVCSERCVPDKRLIRLKHAWTYVHRARETCI